MNSLLKRGSVLSQFYAEEHPSDGNYLAVAGGSTFGIPLDDPEEENGGSGTVTAINTATDRAGPAIPVGTDPMALAMTPNGRTPLRS